MKNRDENELPGPPSKPQVTDVTKNSVSLSWQPGMVGASPVTSFVIEAFRFVLRAPSLTSRWYDTHLFSFTVIIGAHGTMLKNDVK